MADAMTYRGQGIDEYIRVLLESDNVTDDDIDFLGIFDGDGCI